MKKYFIETHGCQMNEHDSEKISWILENQGYKETNIMQEADFILFNTCLIRENAEVKLYGQVGSLKALKKNNQDLIIAVCGCMMQVENSRKVILDKHRHVDIIFGTNNIHKLPELINKYNQTKKLVVDIIEGDYNLEDNLEANRLYDFKAFVNIMYGCNNFCTYCVVPYARGREKSRNPEDILLEIRELAEKGYKEITLLGQNVNSYGKSLESKYNFSDLLREVSQIKGIDRIRFMTSHPKDLSEDLIEVMAEYKNICNHIHLPVQSGSNKILKNMNRHYTREEYIDTVKKIKNKIPEISITTDIIVGFPGETEQDFLDTLSLVKEIKYDAAYTFLYSKRKGTKAALMENQVSDTIKHERFQRLLEELYPIFLENNSKYLNKSIPVLVEGISKNNNEILSGRTEGFKLVHFKGDKNLIGNIVNVRINSYNTFILKGIIE